MGHVARSGAWCGACAPRTQEKSTPVGYEPTRGDPIGLAGRRLSHSAKVSMCESSPLHLLHAPYIATRIT